MNSIRLIFFLLICCISSVMIGQESFALGDSSPKWKVDYMFWTYSESRFFEYDLELEICGKNYWRIDLYDNDYAYVRRDGKKVYVRKSIECQEKEYLMYNFGALVGDNLLVGNLNSGVGEDTVMLQVVEIDSVNIETGKAKRLKIAFDRCYDTELLDTVYWIEGVGSLLHPFYSFVCTCDNCETEYYVECLTLGGTPKYKISENTNCDRIEVGLYEESLDDFKVYPNPASDKTTIMSKDEIIAIYIYNIAGKLLNNYKVGTSTKITELSEYESGVYIIQVHHLKGSNFIKLIKQ